nr:hypothetical protein [Kibdelosporangium sp. MJ126-NF4]CTQ90571.1 hypothetical protein [Kibdelosporangium sp. MJ126-NF4]
MPCSDSGPVAAITANTSATCGFSTKSGGYATVMARNDQLAEYRSKTGLV